MRRTHRTLALVAVLALGATAAPFAATAHTDVAERPHHSSTAVASVSDRAALAVEWRVQARAVPLANTGRDWSYLFKGAPGAKPPRWRQCRITWAYQARGGYPGAAHHVRQAFGRVQRRTPFAFVRVPYRAHGNGADIGLRWRTPAADPRLGGPVLGYAMPIATGGQIVYAGIVLDRTARGVLRGFHGGYGRTWGTVLMHEIAHGLGLGHARGTRQVMYPSLTSGNGRWGAGDRAGLRAVSSGCRR